MDRVKHINTLIEQNIRLVYHNLNKMYLQGDTDAESIAYEALWRACEDYKDDLGFKVSTLITVYIRNALGCYLRHINRTRQLSVVSYNNIVTIGADSEVSFLDMIVDPNNAVDKADFIEYYKQVIKEVDILIERFNGKKYSILIEWRDSDYSAVNQKIADKVGVSQSYVNQVIAEFRTKLNKRIKEISA